MIYPIATKRNARKRGPMESRKLTYDNMEDYENIMLLHKTFNILGEKFDEIYSHIGAISRKTVLSSINRMNEDSQEIIDSGRKAE